MTPTKPKAKCPICGKVVLVSVVEDRRWCKVHRDWRTNTKCSGSQLAVRDR